MCKKLEFLKFGIYLKESMLSFEQKRKSSGWVKHCDSQFSMLPSLLKQCLDKCF